MQAAAGSAVAGCLFARKLDPQRQIDIARPNSLTKSGDSVTVSMWLERDPVGTKATSTHWLYGHKLLMEHELLGFF